MSSIFIYGIHSVTMALRHHPEAVHEIWLSRGRDDKTHQIQGLAEQNRIQVIHKDGNDMRTRFGHNHQGVAARRRPLQPLALKEWLARLDMSVQPLVLALDGVQDPHNFGACLRVADACGVSGVITPKSGSTGVSASVHKASSGAAETVPWVQAGNLVRALVDLKEKGFWVMGADQNGDKNLFEADFSGPLVILMGSEGEGLRQLRKKHCDFVVSIPMLGQVESLNMSVSAAVLLYQGLQCRQNTPKP